MISPKLHAIGLLFHTGDSGRVKALLLATYEPLRASNGCEQPTHLVEVAATVNHERSLQSRPVLQSGPPAIAVVRSCNRRITAFRSPTGCERGSHGISVRFHDRTHELVSHAERLIAKNEMEGAVLDQRWYAFRRFGRHQELILGASQVVFYGGLEDQVRRQAESHYTS